MIYACNNVIVKYTYLMFDYRRVPPFNPCQLSELAGEPCRWSEWREAEAYEFVKCLGGGIGGNWIKTYGKHIRDSFCMMLQYTVYIHICHRYINVCIYTQYIYNYITNIFI